MSRLQTSDKIYHDHSRRKGRRHDPHRLVLEKGVDDIPEIVHGLRADLTVAQNRLVLLYISQIPGDDHAESYADRASGRKEKARNDRNRVLNAACKSQRQKKDNSCILG